MFEGSRSGRLWVTAGILLGAFFLLHSVGRADPIIPRKPLGDLPLEIANWRGQDAPLTTEVIQAVGVSDYASRVYVDQADPPIQLYVGYYASQKTGDTIHSPKNCLPGAGWDPIKSGFIRISIPGGHQIIVNRYVIQKDQLKALVFYWYQGRGRVVASEYAGKLWMMMDSISRDRTDGALVRLVTPINHSETEAQSRLVEFTQLVFPDLDALIPK